MNDNPLILGAFIILILGILFFDLLIIGRKSHIVSFKESIFWSLIWISFTLIFYVCLKYYGEKIHGIQNIEDIKEITSRYSSQILPIGNDLAQSIQEYRNNLATEFITGYLIEYTLSLDNVFVIMLILSSFSINEKHYKRILFWGILGAIILRCFFIFTGSALVQRFEWILLVFGAFLLFSGLKMFFTADKEEKKELHDHWLVKFLSKRFNVYPRLVKGYFFVIKKNKLFITPLFIVLVLVEFSDIIFAVDSIPAIFSVTKDPYIVFFSNIFAIIGLRTLFFLLSNLVNLFRFLKIGIAALLTFIGLKLLFHSWLEAIDFKTIYSLYIILGILVLSILSSVLIPKKQTSNK